MNKENLEEWNAAVRDQLAKDPRPPEDPLLRKLMQEHADICKQHGTYSEKAKASHARCMEQHPNFERALQGIHTLAASIQQDIVALAENQGPKNWHCNGPCNSDQPHEILANDDEGCKTRCLKCDRETWR